MAVEQPGTFLLEVADIGVELNTAFTKFITYRKVHDRRLENLYATLNISTGALKALGTTFNTHAADFEMKEDVTRRLAEKAKSVFVALLTMINEGNAEGGAWKSEGTINGQTIATEVDPWLLITMAVGGTEDAKDFWQGLDDTRDALVELEHVVKYKILKSMEKKNTLSPTLEQELKKLKALLPRIVQRHETIAKSHKAEAERLARIEEDEKRIAERVRANQRNSFASSDFTIRADDRRRPSSPSSERIIIKKCCDSDACSVSTYCSTTSGPLDHPSTPTQIYEEWSLRWIPPIKKVDKSWGFLGLKLKSYYEDVGYWATESELRTEAEMREQEMIAGADMTYPQAQALLRKALQALPKKGGLEIDRLLNERTECTSHEEAKREWIVVAVRPKQKYAYGSSKKWGKDPLTTDWLVTLRGTTIDTENRSRSYRGHDPFLARQASRSRSPYRPCYRSISPLPRRRPRYPVVERYIRPRSRDRSPFRPLPVMRNPIRSLPIREREVFVEDGYVQGKVVVGKIMTRDEAEEKMVGIWEEMVKKAADVVEKKDEVVDDDAASHYSSWRMDMEPDNPYVLGRAAAGLGP